MTNKFKTFYTPILLVFIFFLPGIVAITVYQNPSILSTSKTNHGELLSPPKPFFPKNASNKWQIVFWHPTRCDKTCLTQLDKLARLRLALGRRLYQVDMTYVGLDEKNDMVRDTFNDFKAYDIKWLKPSESQQNKLLQWSKNPKIYLADPNGYLILAYQTDENLKNIHQDLKKLLNVKE